jgi:hypothetical protein
MRGGVYTKYTEMPVHCIGSKTDDFSVSPLNSLLCRTSSTYYLIIYMYIFSEAERETQGDAATQLRP